MAEPERVIESVARASYARLISFLAARSNDVASAEDALSEAFVAALRTWPTQGVPSKPEAWLLQAARHRLIDRIRSKQTQAAHAAELRATLAEAEARTEDFTFPDERLKLLFVCAHPAIDARVHTPLMLQVVLGLDANSIAEAFVTPPATIGQRLSRAKAKIRDTRIAFDIPAGTELAPRLSAVLEAIYAAYNRGWDDVDGVDAQRRGLAEESIWLARLLSELLPEQPEALALLALMQYCEARRPARRTPEGEYVPIAAQDTNLWLADCIDEAESLLRRAATFQQHGRFQLEAAVQSAHVQRARTGSTNWPVIALLYEGLVRCAPTIGALLGRAAAVGEAHGAAAGLELLKAIPLASVANHQPYWAVRAHLERQLGLHADAHTHFERAIRLTEDPAVRRFLARNA
ncbi:MAG: RNA polymerase sigma factor [Myxococcota bacterium]